MARRILQAAALVALVAFSSAASAARCVASGNAASVVPVGNTRCMVLYASGWRYLHMQTSMDGSTNTINVNGLKNAPLYVEFYRDAECAPNAYLDALECSTGSVPTNPPTQPPTTRPPPTNPPATNPPVGGTGAPATNGYNGGPPVGQMRAMYLWGLGSCLFNQVSSSQYPSRCSGQSSYTAYQDWLLNQLRNPSGRYAPYNHMYLDVNPNLLASQTALVRAFLKKAAAVGVTTELLTGDANWVISSSAAQTPINICKQVATFNRGTASASERFYGIHLDIEPYLTPGWESNNGAGRDPWNDAYQNTLINILRTCKNEGASSNMIVSWAIPTWFSALAHDLFDPLLQSPFVDYVVVMNYYSNQNLWINGPGGNVGGIVNNLNRLQGKVPAVFAAETQDTSVVPSSESFWAGGRLKMENMFGVAGFQFRSHAGFKGTATHFLDSYLKMPA